jgi:hypothetical protein
VSQEAGRGEGERALVLDVVGPVVVAAVVAAVVVVAVELLPKRLVPHLPVAVNPDSENVTVANHFFLCVALISVGEWKTSSTKNTKKIQFSGGIGEQREFHFLWTPTKKFSCLFLMPLVAYYCLLLALSNIYDSLMTTPLAFSFLFFLILFF